MISIVLFNSIAALLITVIIIWFWVMKGKLTQAQTNEVTIKVKDGVYSPNRIKTKQTNLVLNFIREDASLCSEYVLFEELDIHEQLPLNMPHKIHLNDLKPGNYKFMCQMGMYQGELIIIPR